MRFLITGGAGFIGGHLTERLLDAGHEVTVIDDFSTGSRDNLAAVANHRALTVVEGDVLTAAALPTLVAESDFIFHLAAAVGVELVVHDPVRTIRTNVEGSARVIQLASERNKPIILASTSEVYGKSSKGEFSESDDLLIGCPVHSRWSYACSKLLDEFYLMAYHRNRNLAGVVVRFFNTVGPRQTGQYGMVVPRFVKAALAGEPLRVYGDGGQSRCFCHVSDTVRALVGLAARAEQAAGRIFNIGNTEPVTIMALAETVIARLNSASKIELVPYDEAYEKGFEDMRRRRPDTGAIREFLGWHPEHDLGVIIDDVAAAMRGARKNDYQV